MIAGPSGARVLRLGFFRAYCGLVAPLRLAALPLLEEVCYAFVVGVWEVELWAAVVLADCIGSATLMRLMSVLLSISLTPLLLRFSSFVGVSSEPVGLLRLGGRLSLSFWDAVCRHGPCGPICSLHPWDGWVPLICMVFTGGSLILRRS